MPRLGFMDVIKQYYTDMKLLVKRKQCNRARDKRCFFDNVDIIKLLT